jgi:hypothetical protein
MLLPPPKKKKLPFCYQQKNWYIPNGSNNSNKCLQKIEHKQIAKQHKTTRSLHKTRAKKNYCVARSFGSREGETKIITNLPQNQNMSQ